MRDIIKIIRANWEGCVRLEVSVCTSCVVLHILRLFAYTQVWNLMPLPCLPMFTGHNCFGAVLTPTTMAEFVIADVTDSQLE